MNKKWMFIVIGLLLVVGIISIGGFYMDIKKNDKNNLNQNLVKKQEELALYIVQNYEDVEEIQFKNAYKIEETGTWHLSAMINGSNKLKFSIDKDRSPSNPRIGYDSNDFQLIEKKRQDNSDLSTVKVIYLEGNDD